VSRTLHEDDDMPIRARHGRRLRAPTLALLGAVAGAVLLAACGGVSPSPASPPATTRPVQPRAPTSTLAPARTPSTRGVDLGLFEVSCYTGKGVTALGTPSSQETAAVDPRIVALGTRLVIDTVGARVAADTGGSITGRRLDVWESSAAACARFGHRQLRVWMALQVAGG
jgi:3D (Asp-Asp-Asp) domain-containing protein